MHRHPQQRPLNQQDIGRRVHELVHGETAYHGGNLPLSAPNLRALLELLEADGHDVAALREELAHLLRTLLRARHLAVKLTRAAR